MITRRRLIVSNPIIGTDRRNSASVPWSTRRPRTQDADPVADRLHLAQDVRGEEHGLPALLCLAHRLAEGHLHQRAKAAGRLVEDQQLGAACEGRDQLHLLPVPVREHAHLLARVELKALDQLLAVASVSAAAHASEELERLRTRQCRPQVGLRGDVGHAAMGLDRLRPGVDAEELRPPGARAQQPDRRRLAGTVRPQVAVHLAAFDR
jgi:hypothetical protein